MACRVPSYAKVACAKKFIHELQSLPEFMGCTALILTGDKSSTLNYPQRTMVDRLVQLALNHVDMRTVRELRVVKHRGSSHLTGSNSYEISEAGVTVYPSVEERPLFYSEPIVPNRAQLKTGIPGFDELLGGGIAPGSTTALVGSACTTVSIEAPEGGLSAAHSLVDLLDDEGYGTIGASNGKVALRKLEEQLTDLILIDIMMPVMDGRDRLRCPRQQPRYASIPVVLRFWPILNEWLS